MSKFAGLCAICVIGVLLWGARIRSRPPEEVVDQVQVPTVEAVVEAPAEPTQLEAVEPVSTSPVPIVVPDEAPPAQPATSTSDLYASLLPVVSDLRARVHDQGEEIAGLRLLLDECQNGPDSVLGAMFTTQEWEVLDAVQRRTVQAFIKQFPVRLESGEATLIASDHSTAELIALLGQNRVLDAMGVEAWRRFQAEDPYEFAEYFGPQRR